MKNSLSSKNAGGGGFDFDMPAPPPSMASLTRLRDVLKESHKQQQGASSSGQRRGANQRHNNNNYQRRMNQNNNYQNLLSQIECTLNESLEACPSNSELKKVNRISFIELLKLIDASETTQQSSPTPQPKEQPVDFFHQISDVTESKHLNSNSQMIISKIENDLKESMSILCQYNSSMEGGGTVDNIINDYTIVEEENESELGLDLNKCQDKHRGAGVYENKGSNLSVENKLFSNFNRNDLTRKNILATVKTADSVSKRRNSVDHIVLPPPPPPAPTVSTANGSTSCRLKTSVSQFNYETVNFGDVVSNGSFVKSDKYMNGNDINATNTTTGDPVADTSAVESHWNYDELNELREKFISLLSSDSTSINHLNTSCDLFSNTTNNNANGKSDEESSNKRFSLDQNTVSIFGFVLEL
jgi:hypothetical protein